MKKENKKNGSSPRGPYHLVIRAFVALDNESESEVTNFVQDLFTRSELEGLEKRLRCMLETARDERSGKQRTQLQLAAELQSAPAVVGRAREALLHGKGGALQVVDKLLSEGL